MHLSNKFYTKVDHHHHNDLYIQMQTVLTRLGLDPMTLCSRIQHAVPLFLIINLYYMIMINGTTQELS